MKSWAEMGSAGRGGVVAVVGAVIAALFYGAWTVSRPPVVEEAVVTATGTQAEPEGAAEGSAETAPASAPEADVAAAEPAAEEVASAVEAPDASAEEAAPSGEAEPTTEAATVAEEGTAAEPAPETETEAAAETAPAEAEVAEAAPEAPAPTPPSFDLVRVEKDGSALVAGSAAPGASVSLRVTGAELAAVPADGQGKFVAMFNLAPSAAPRVLSMSMALADGTVVPADATVVIGPTVAPAVVAEVPEAIEATGEAVADAEVAAAEPAAEPVVESVTEAPAALLVTEDGAKVLQSAAEVSPELVANVTIDTITYTDAGAVQLAGRGTAERVVRLYLDNAQVAETPIGAAGDWAVTLPEVAPGVYVLRADQLDSTGKVTSRFETPFKRETVEALAAASGAAETAAEETEATSAQTGQTETAAADSDTSSTEAGTEAAGEPTAVSPTTVTVQPGFTLWRIATENLGDGIRYVQVFEANKDQIRDPDLIYPGQVFTIPAAE
ncbi:MAG: LysM peptidoglycan-binding domain-containing protein [Rhodobacteraceae bacterium]|nr:LysM peptidoglycan-binding domain-containing protein [Paracoccaceae bacterium]